MKTRIIMAILVCMVMSSCAGIAVGRYKGPNGSVAYGVGDPESFARGEKITVKAEEEYQVGVTKGIAKAKSDAEMKSAFAEAIKKNPDIARDIAVPDNPNAHQFISRRSTADTYTGASKYEYTHGGRNVYAVSPRRGARGQQFRQPNYDGCENDNACYHYRYCEANPASPTCQ